MSKVNLGAGAAKKTRRQFGPTVRSEDPREAGSKAVEEFFDSPTGERLLKYSKRKKGKSGGGMVKKRK
jgi:hypothetical protein